MANFGPKVRSGSGIQPKKLHFDGGPPIDSITSRQISRSSRIEQSSSRFPLRSKVSLILIAVSCMKECVSWLPPHSKKFLPRVILVCPSSPSKANPRRAADFFRDSEGDMIYSKYFSEGPSLPTLSGLGVWFPSGFSRGRNFPLTFPVRMIGEVPHQQTDNIFPGGI